MDTTYRFRFLIYLAAFMLAMSLCFVYAEPLPSRNQLLFQVAPQHSAFLVPSADVPTFDPDALRAAAPVVSLQILQQLEDASRAHHSLFHHARHTVHSSAPANIQSESSVLSPGVASLHRAR